MIYTLTLNPSLDYLVDVQDIKLHGTNRSKSEYISFGGKGINVTSVLNELGVDSICLGFTAGFTGTELERLLKNEGIKTDFVHLETGNTRINVKIKDSEITEINANGPVVYKDDLQKLYEKLLQLKDTDVLLLAGSLPNGANEDLYENIISKLDTQKIRVCVDTAGKKLLKLLKYKPFLIKPNIDELQQIVEKTLATDEEIVDAARLLKQSGAVNVLVSRGKDGAILVDEYGVVHKCCPHKITSVNAAAETPKTFG